MDYADLSESFPTTVWLQNLASIQPRTSPVKFAHLAEKSENGSISNLSTKVPISIDNSTATFGHQPCFESPADGFKFTVHARPKPYEYVVIWDDTAVCEDSELGNRFIVYSDMGYMLDSLTYRGTTYKQTDYPYKHESFAIGRTKSRCISTTCSVVTPQRQIARSWRYASAEEIWHMMRTLVERFDIEPLSDFSSK